MHLTRKNCKTKVSALPEFGPCCFYALFVFAPRPGAVYDSASPGALESLEGASSRAPEDGTQLQGRLSPGLAGEGTPLGSTLFTQAIDASLMNKAFVFTSPFGHTYRQ